ncbi:biliverdin-producing heme oxygenase [Caulobacter sp. S45]|uniref:biliverdin-producing heme oxygenase n=1 Tax=Caulobacter sp. S45 TaxID=1641861 RepID=UPI00131BFE36|nr:biliverdin-producing heme oxygenase [Caulobacter sp. S45]
MTREPLPKGAGVDVMDRLRAATAVAHRRLERDLDLLRPPLLKDRFARLLERFWGFHVVWEATVGRHGDLAALMTSRSRLVHLKRDLQALGLSAHEIARLPQCAAAADLSHTVEAAIGSLYVMEGSTLGGRLIGRALQGRPWLPEAGLTYFDPYRTETGTMWRAFQDHVRSASSDADQPAIEAGATQTFELLRGWLTRPPASAQNSVP